MKRKHWIILGSILATLVLLCAGVVGGYLLYKQQRSDALLAQADAYFESGEWNQAKSKYAWYLADQPKESQALRKYAQASMNITENRGRMLRDASAAYYQLALDNPNDQESLDKLRDIYLRLNSWADLEYISGLSMHSADPALKYYHALALNRLNRRDQAIEAYRELIAEDTQYAEAYGDLALLFLGQNLIREANDVFAQAEQSKPGDPYILIQRARFEFARDDLEAGDKYLSKAAALIPGDPKLLAMDAQAAIMHLDWTTAIKLSKVALAQSPEDNDLHLGLINAYQTLEMYEEAVAHLQDMPELLRVDSPTFQSVNIELLLRLERIDEAETALAQYELLYPDNNTIHEYLEALCLLAKGDAATAAIRLTNTVETLPSFRQARLYLAIACLQSQQRNRAKVVLEKYRSDYPGDIASAEIYEREFGPKVTIEQARRTAQSLLDNTDADAASLVAAATTLVRLSGQPSASDPEVSQARQLFAMVIKAEPNDPAAYLALADLELTLQDPQSATQLIDKAVENGVEFDSLWIVRAAISIVSGDTEAGFALFRKQHSETPMTLNDVMRAANMFVSRGTFSDGLAILDEAAAQLDPSERTTLEIERIGMAARFGQAQKAVNYLREMERRADLPPQTLTALNARKEVIIRAMIQPGPMNDPVQARTLVEELQKTLPKNKDIQLLKARVLLQQPSPELQAAREAVEPLLENGTQNIQAMLTLADIALKEGRLSVALSYTEKALAAAPEDTGVRILLAEIQFRMQYFLDATATLEQALASDPSDRRTMGLLVEAYRATDRHIQAEILLTRIEQSIKESGGSLDGVNALRARILLDQGEQLEYVEDLFRKQHEADPTDFRAVSDLARVLSKLNRPDDAEYLLKDFAESQTNRADAWVALAQLYLAKGDSPNTSKVSSAYTRALLIDKNYPPALLGFVQLELSNKNTAKALGLCDRYLQQEPNDPTVLFLKAYLLAQRIDTTEHARGIVTQAIDIVERPEYLYLRAVINLNTQRYPDAIQDLNRINHIQGGTTTEVDLGFAEAYWATGQKDLAKRYYLDAAGKIDNSNLDNSKRLKRIGDRIESEEENS